MSGICGLIHFDGEPVESAHLRRMAEAAGHRGPDGIRYHVLGSIGLAHLALAITPESLMEEQPLVDGDLALAADARIDNRADLISLLGDKNLLPRGNPTDADLILAAYRHWGPECPAHLLGDFAFAVWDSSCQRLFAARDAMAMRAFYYRAEANRLLFGTEVKQILNAKDVPCRLFEPAVAAHLAGPYGRPEWSFYEGISQLPPAHALAASVSGIRVWRYWDWNPDDRLECRSEEEYWEYFRERFAEAVRCRMRSIKPVGVSLSGGTDSGSIASMAGWLRSRDEQLCPGLRAYCYSFSSLPQCDERHISDQIVRHYNLQVSYIPADDLWPLKNYPGHGPDRDEPFAGIYQALMDSTLAAAQRDGVGVLFAGERGDEVAGTWVYDFPGLLATGQWRTLWAELKASAELRGVSLHGALKREVLRPLIIGARAKTSAAFTHSPRLKATAQTVPPWIPREFALRTELAELLAEKPPPLSHGSARLERYHVIFSTISMRRVAWLERSHARFQLAFADPWSDRRVVETVLSMPQWAVNRLGESKRLARQALRGIVPEPVRSNTCKTEPFQLFDLGFQKLAKNTVLGLIRESKAASLGYIDSEALLASYESFCDGKPSVHDFWWPLSFEMWLRSFWTKRLGSYPG